MSHVPQRPKLATPSHAVVTESGQDDPQTTILLGLKTLETKDTTPHPPATDEIIEFLEGSDPDETISKASLKSHKAVHNTRLGTLIVREAKKVNSAYALPYIGYLIPKDKATTPILRRGDFVKVLIKAPKLDITRILRLNDGSTKERRHLTKECLTWNNKDNEPYFYNYTDHIEWAGQRFTEWMNERRIGNALGYTNSLIPEADQKHFKIHAVADVFIPSVTKLAVATSTNPKESEYLAQFTDWQIPISIQPYQENLTTAYTYIDSEDGNKRNTALVPEDSKTFGQALLFAATLAKAIQFCHEHGVVHNDLHPGNIHYNQATNELALIDFGSSVIRGISAVTRTRDGVPAEYRDPHPDTLGTMQADIFSYGMVLYRVLVKIESRSTLFKSVNWKGDQTSRRPLSEDKFVELHGSTAICTKFSMIVSLICSCLWQNLDQRPKHMGAVCDHLADIVYSFPDLPNRETLSSILGISAQQGEENNPLTLALEGRKSAIDQLLLAAGQFDKVVELYEPIDQLRSVMRSVMSHLPVNSFFGALDSGNYWSDGNMGIEGDLLSANVAAAQNGVTVFRAFLLARDFVDEIIDRSSILSEERDMEHAKALFGRLACHGSVASKVEAMRVYAVVLPRRKLDTMWGGHPCVGVATGWQGADTIELESIYGAEDSLIGLRFVRVHGETSSAEALIAEISALCRGDRVTSVMLRDAFAANLSQLTCASENSIDAVVDLLRKARDSSLTGGQV